MPGTADSATAAAEAMATGAGEARAMATTCSNEASEVDRDTVVDSACVVIPTGITGTEDTAAKAMEADRAMEADKGTEVAKAMAEVKAMAADRAMAEAEVSEDVVDEAEASRATMVRCELADLKVADVLSGLEIETSEYQRKGRHS